MNLPTALALLAVCVPTLASSPGFLTYDSFAGEPDLKVEAEE